jgi:hypothetical protein
MPNGFADDLWKGAGDAIADVREKFEEAVWGRAVTERGEGAQWPQAEEPQHMEPEGLNGEILPPEAAASHEAAGPLLEHGTVINQEPGRDDTALAHWPEAREPEPEHERNVPEQDIER